MAIVLWIGIVICGSKFFTSSDSKYAPAVVIGILPGIAAWGALIAKSQLENCWTWTTRDNPSVPV